MIQSLDEQGRGLRFVFYRPPLAADRWGHLVATVVNGGESGETVVPRLVSQEGTGPDGWPLSPPLQSLAIERRVEGAVALLVGMWGQHHWSASFEAKPGRRLVIDIACRLSAGAGECQLRSSYWCSTSGIANAAGMELAGDENSRLLLEVGPEAQAETSAGGLVLGVRRTMQRPIRWKYEVGCGEPQQ
jgi:hypothetical protein